jgi:hypothetical protein
VKVR